MFERFSIVQSMFSNEIFNEIQINIVTIVVNVVLGYVVWCVVQEENTKNDANLLNSQLV